MALEERKHLQGKVAYRVGLAAEEEVGRHYGCEGFVLVDRRWRGLGGEIDLVFAKGDQIVFVEVKKAKTVRRALSQLRHRQLSRFAALGEEYLGSCPNGLATVARWDLAAVGCAGHIEIVENISIS